MTDYRAVNRANWDGRALAHAASPDYNTTHEWNHGLGEIVTAVLDAGMTVTGLREHQSRAVGRAARPDDPGRGQRVAAHGSTGTAAALVHSAGRAGSRLKIDAFGVLRGPITTT
jgi:hypothetical protein